MAYESMTYEVILHRMMERVTAKYPNLDNREGSIIFNALAPAAFELAVMYTELDNVINESFVKTATREYLLLGCKEIGMNVAQFDASAGVHKGEFNVEVPIGSRWNCELFNYNVTELIGLNSDTGYYEYKLSCETLGTSPNNQTGHLTAITLAPNNLTHAELTECLIEGENETTDDDIRTAYHDFVNNLASDGNVAQYKRWCMDYSSGIGNCKIFPLWNGANTVKVSILSSSNKAASEELVAEFQEYLDPGCEGMGNGVAPIGAFVTVTTATEVPINVNATIKMKDGYTDTSDIATLLTEYLASIAYNKSTVAYMNIGATILNGAGVDFVSDLTINDSMKDIFLGEEQIPVLGTTNWTVVN
jgi:uncharacterized phage protein gp47/JayE